LTDIESGGRLILKRQGLSNLYQTASSELWQRGNSQPS